MFRLEIFRVGKHTDSEGVTTDFTPEIVQGIVDNYDPKVWRAPLVLGHPEHDDQAYGWVDRLLLENGLMLAEGEEVDESLVKAVDKKLYQNVSVSLYIPEHPSNPMPGQWYLRHVGLLGAQAPAVKGLKPIKFREGNFLVFGEGKQAALGKADLEKAAQEKAAREKAAREKAALEKVAQEKAAAEKAAQEKAAAEKAAAEKAAAEKAAAEKAAAEKAAQEKADQEKAAQEKAALEKVAQEKAALEKVAQEQAVREATLKAGFQELRERETASFVDDLVKQGRLLPTHRTSWIGVLTQVPESGRDVKFSEKEALQPGAALRRLLSEMPQVVTLREVAGDSSAPPAELTSEQVAARARQYIDNQAKLGRTVGVVEAVNAVTRRESE